MTRVLVTGATGFIGGHLVPALAAAGFRVRAAARRAAVGDALPGAEEAVAVGDIGRATDWSAALAGIDAVVHAAARAHQTGDRGDDAAELYDEINHRATRRLAEQCAAAGVRRLVFLSSIKAMGEGGPGRPPFRPDQPPAPQDAYGRSKRDAERALAELADRAGDAAPRVAVLRLPLVYGPGVKGNFAALARQVARGVPLPFGAIRNRRSLLYVGNLADLVEYALTSGQLDGRTVLPSDGPPVSTPALVRAMAQAMGRRARLVPVPLPALRLGFRLTGRGDRGDRLSGDLAVEDPALTGPIGWHPPWSMAEGLRRTFAAG